jgi:hypothetical protein
MAKITVKKLITTNTVPTIKGTVEFERFDANRNPKETIQVVVNFNTYKLFENGLGIDETKTPTVWKLQINSPLFPGTYDVEANVIEVGTNRIVASDETVDELIIQTQQAATGFTPPKPTIAQKVATIAALLGAANSLFGGQSGISALPSVHPTDDDDSSTALAGRGKEERNQDPSVKSMDKVRSRGNPATPPKVGNDKTSNQQMGNQTITSAEDLDKIANNPENFIGDVTQGPAQTLEAAMDRVSAAPDLAASLAQQTFAPEGTPAALAVGSSLL